MVSRQSNGPWNASTDRRRCLFTDMEVPWLEGNEDNLVNDLRLQLLLLKEALSVFGWCLSRWQHILSNFSQYQNKR